MTVKMADEVRYAGMGAFEGCGNLKEVYLSADMGLMDKELLSDVTV